MYSCLTSVYISRSEKKTRTHHSTTCYETFSNAQETCSSLKWRAWSWNLNFNKTKIVCVLINKRPDETSLRAYWVHIDAKRVDIISVILICLSQTWVCRFWESLYWNHKIIWLRTWSALLCIFFSDVRELHRSIGRSLVLFRTESELQSFSLFVSIFRDLLRKILASLCYDASFHKPFNLKRAFVDE